MQLRSCLAFALLLMSATAQSATAQSPNPALDKTCTSSATAGDQAAPCNPKAAGPVLMVAIHSATPAVGTTGTPQPAAVKIDDAPYETFLDRSPLMRTLAWYCAVMAPIALLLLTGFTIFEYRKRRSGGHDA